MFIDYAVIEAHPETVEYIPVVPHKAVAGVSK